MESFHRVISSFSHGVRVIIIIEQRNYPDLWETNIPRQAIRSVQSLVPPIINTHYYGTMVSSALVASAAWCCWLPRIWLRKNIETSLNMICEILYIYIYIHIILGHLFVKFSVKFARRDLYTVYSHSALCAASRGCELAPRVLSGEAVNCHLMLPHKAVNKRFLCGITRLWTSAPGAPSRGCELAPPSCAASRGCELVPRVLPHEAVNKRLLCCITRVWTSASGAPSRGCELAPPVLPHDNARR